MKNKYLLIIFILVVIVKSNGFCQAVRWNYLGIADPLISDNGSIGSGNEINLPLYNGLGYEQNFGNRIALSLEYNISFNNLSRTSKTMLNSGHFDGNYNSDGYSFGVDFPMHEISYQSKYFFRDNDERATYVSFGLALHTINYTWSIRKNYYYSSGTTLVPDDFREGDFKESVTTVPLTIRLGARGAINGSFGDYSIGFRYNLSGDKGPTNKTYKYVAESSLRDLSFIFCMSWGIGWAK